MLNSKLEKQRKILYQNINCDNLTESYILQLSQKLDEAIVEYYKSTLTKKVKSA